MGIVTLVSGGFDSTLMSIMAQEEGIALFPLFIDYGQLGATKEWEACQRLHEIHKLPKAIRMDLSGFGKTIPSGIVSAMASLRVLAGPWFFSERYSCTHFAFNAFTVSCKG